MKVIYRPRSRALEYAPYAVNIALGCVHGCRYCFSPRTLHKDRAEFYARPAIRPGIADRVTADLQEMAAMGEKGPVLLCFACDPYQTPEVAEITKAVLEAFASSPVSFVILTKGGLRAGRDYDLYRPGDAFATTLTYFDAAKSREVEPGAADPEDRIEAIRRAKARGISTWVSFEPALEAESVRRLFMATKDHVDLFKFGKVSGYPSSIADWHAYASGVVRLCEEFGKPYYIKNDLRKHLSLPPKGQK